MRRIASLAALFLLSTAVILGQPSPTTAATSVQSQIDAHTQEINLLNQEIAKYEAEIKKANTNKATLQNAINTLELQKKKVQAQINATQNQISSTQLQINQLSSSIASIENTINANEAALAEDMRAIQKTDAKPLIVQLLSTGTLSDAWNDVDATTQLNGAIESKVQQLAAQKTALADTRANASQKKTALTVQRNTLSSQKTSLLQTTHKKSQLLAETNASEAQYQKLLAKAKSELASFSTFAQNAGGSGLLYNQTTCDSWGCYYNQRDSQWGNDPLDGTKYNLKSDGCLITSMAMIMTHYGYKNVTPVTINSNPANFAAYYPAYLLMTINVDGMTVTRKRGYLNATLAKGPAVVGIYAYGGTHFVVITKRSGGGYIMRDPYVPNGKDIPFGKYYSFNKIFSVARVVIS